MKSNIENFLQNIESNARANADFDGAYLGADGLLYCAQCNTPKQCKIELWGKIRVVTCMCKCEGERYQQEQQAAELREQQRKIDELRRAGFNNDDIASWTFENSNGSNEKIMQIMRNYVDNFPHFLEHGKGLLLYGNVGTGKTYAAACVANALINKVVPCYMTNFSRARNMVFEDKQRYLDNLQKFRLLVLDDLGAEAKSEYMQEVVFSIIDARYRAGLPMIITTNLSLDEIKNPRTLTEARCYDRILERCYPVEVAGQSQRRKKIIDDYAETKRLLGL
jgi:DNA replication protein DnaC